MELLLENIVHLLKRQQMKPGEISENLGISRQTLHKYLRALVKEKRIQKHDSGPHVSYSAMPGGDTTTRVREDYLLCKTQLLPKYLNEFADAIDAYEKRLHKNATGSEKMDLSFLLASSAVYSSNIEGNTLDLNSFMNSRMAPGKHRPKEAEEIEDLVSAYENTKKRTLTEKNMLAAHKMLSEEFVAKTRQGIYRKERVGVFSQSGLVYMAIEPHLVVWEMLSLFTVIDELLHTKQSPTERFFWATWIHLMIALIHPFSDGNGRTARLCEKWYLVQTIGEHCFAVNSEEIYWNNRLQYYAALKLGVNYWETDTGKAFPFFALLPEALMKEKDTG